MPDGKKPNILFIMGDDIGWSNISAYNLGIMGGDWPVMKAARPTVQLCCPYQSVNSAPSFAMRSILGVR